jgi:hypothetical protein
MSEMLDWDIGHYEEMAVELEPVAEHVVSLADVQRGERVVDLATAPATPPCWLPARAHL